MGRTACTEPQCLYKGALYLYIALWVIYFIIICSILFYFMDSCIFQTLYIKIYINYIYVDTVDKI
jgi:hypothetical protein